MSPRMVLGVIVVLLAASAPSLVVGEPVDPVRPVAAVGIGMGPSALVAWVPGAETPDFFRIYGVRNETMAFLSVADPDATTATVPGGFPEYAVTAVRNGVESDPALAMLGVGLVCVTVSPGMPPGIAVGSSCATKVEGKVAVMTTTWNPSSTQPSPAFGTPCVTVGMSMSPGMEVGSFCADVFVVLA